MTQARDSEQSCRRTRLSRFFASVLQVFKACVGASNWVAQSAKVAGCTRNHSVLNSSKQIKTAVGVHMARRHA